MTDTMGEAHVPNKIDSNSQESQIELMRRGYVDGYKDIGKLVGRCQRTIQKLVRRKRDPLPVYKIGGIVRLNIVDYERWLHAQHDHLERFTAEEVRMAVEAVINNKGVPKGINDMDRDDKKIRVEWIVDDIITELMQQLRSAR